MTIVKTKPRKVVALLLLLLLVLRLLGSLRGDPYDAYRYPVEPEYGGYGAGVYDGNYNATQQGVLDGHLTTDSNGFTGYISEDGCSYIDGDISC